MISFPQLVHLTTVLNLWGKIAVPVSVMVIASVFSQVLFHLWSQMEPVSVVRPIGTLVLKYRISHEIRAIGSERVFFVRVKWQNLFFSEWRIISLRASKKTQSLPQEPPTGLAGSQYSTIHFPWMIQSGLPNVYTGGLCIGRYHDVEIRIHILYNSIWNTNIIFYNIWTFYYKYVC